MLTVNVQKTTLGEVLAINVAGHRILISTDNAMQDCIKRALESKSDRSLYSILTGDCSKQADFEYVQSRISNRRSSGRGPAPLPTPTSDDYWS